MKNEIINMLLAFGICDNRKQAQNFVKDKSEEDIRELYKVLLRQRHYAFIND